MTFLKVSDIWKIGEYYDSYVTKLSEILKYKWN